ncbi:flagellar motor protein MotB [Aeribacillus pallidus]|jgi:chemotaxis protein MotB|uniref:flagellar motor protein MotB n=1 Tax=Aeribacillus pallidus TaxID=33936 RepID=UPI003D211040
MSRRKKKHEHEHIDETWLIPYADLLTLLLALFIVLFSMSSVDAKKFQALSQVFNELFIGGTGVMEYQTPVPANEEGKQTKDITDDDIQAKEQEELTKLKAKIDTYIKQRQLADKFETSLSDEGLLLTIRDNVLFESGSAEVRPEDVDVAREVSNLLIMNPPRNIIISGHTDNVPINNSEFSSNWELSVMRAVNFMKLLLENDQLDPRWFSAKGFGEFQPIAPNDTESGRAKNRRVEVLILPRTG